MIKFNYFKHVLITLLLSVLFLSCSVTSPRYTTRNGGGISYAFFIDSITIGFVNSEYTYETPDGDYGAFNYIDGNVSIWKYDINSKQVNKLDEINTLLTDPCAAKFCYPWLAFLVNAPSGHASKMYLFNVETNEISFFKNTTYPTYCITGNGRFILTSGTLGTWRLIDIQNDSLIYQDTGIAFYVNEEGTEVLSTPGRNYLANSYVFLNQVLAGNVDTISIIDTLYTGIFKVFDNNKLMATPHWDNNILGYANTTDFKMSNSLLLEMPLIFEKRTYLCDMRVNDSLALFCYAGNIYLEQLNKQVINITDSLELK